MDKKIKKLISRIKKHLIKKYGKEIKQIILYGSHVRDQATHDSDIDLLIIVDDSLNPSEVRKSLSDILFDIVLEEKEQISVIAAPEPFFNSYNTPFILNVKGEGITV